MRIVDNQPKPTEQRSGTGIVVHESTPPLLRAIGTTVILVATLVGAIQARMELKAAHAAQQAAQEESIVDDVVLNPWFEFLGMAGTGIVAMSFYADWLSKRGKRGGL